jgi:predicted nucleic acid-binding protein
LSVVLDSSFVVGYYEAGGSDQARTAAWYEQSDEDFVTSPLAVAEMDYLVVRRGGPPAREALWGDLTSGAWQVRWWADAMDETLAIARKRPEIGLVYASLVALAHRLRTDRIATFDHHHFRTLKTRNGKPFTILPDDA